MRRSPSLPPLRTRSGPHPRGAAAAGAGRSRGSRRARTLTLALALGPALALPLASCSSDRVTTVEVATVRVSPEASTLVVGESRRFAVDLRDQDGHALPASIVDWTVEPASVLRVDGSGVVEAVGPGTGVVRATARNVSATASVTVQPGPTFRLSRPAVEIRGLVGGATPPEPETVRIDNAGAGTLGGLVATVRYASGSGGWLTPSLESTVAPTTLRLSAATPGLQLGSYDAVVRLASGAPGAEAVEVPVTLRVVSDQPTVGASPGLVAFSGISGSSRPPPQAVVVENVGGGSLEGLVATVQYEQGSGWLDATLLASTAPTTLTLRADPGSLPRGTFRARVRVAPAGAPEAGSDVVVSFEVGAQADLRALLVGPDTVVAGSRVRYEVRLRNHGPSSAESVVVVDTLPANASLVEVPPGATFFAGILRWDLGSFPSGAQRAFDVEVDVAPSAVGRIGHRLFVESPTPDPEPAGRVAETGASIVRSADLETFLSGPDTVFVGGVADLRVVVRNRGPSDAISVSVTDTLPDGLTFVSTPGGGNVVGRVVSWPPVPTLAAGDSLVLGLRASVAAGPGLELRSTAAARTAAPDPEAGNDASSLVLATAERAGLTALAGGPPTADNGEVITLVAGVGNTGPGAARGVVVSQLLPRGVKLVSAAGGAVATPDGGLRWPAIERILPGDTVAYEVRVEVGVPAPATLAHTVVVSGATPDPLAADDTATASVAVPLVADLALRLDAPALDTAGSPVSYRFVVRNEGPDPATGIQVVDSLPAGTEVISSSGGVADATGSAVTWPAAPSLAVGDSLVHLLVVAYGPGAEGSSPVHRAHVTSTSLDRDTLDDRAAGTTLLAAAADLAVTVSGPASVSSPDTVPWVVRVENRGPSRARAVRVVDTLPVGVALVDVTGQGTASGRVIAWPVVDSLGPGETVSFTVRAVADPTTLGPLVNRARVSASTPDPLAANDAGSSTAALPRPADLSVEVFVLAADTAGTLLTYTLRVRNTGPSDAGGVTLVDTLPAGVTFVSADGSPVVAGGVVTWDLTTVRDDRSKTRRLTVRIDVGASTPIVNRARVSSDHPDTDQADNVDAATTTVIPPPVGPSGSGPWGGDAGGGGSGGGGSGGG